MRSSSTGILSRSSFAIQAVAASARPGGSGREALALARRGPRGFGPMLVLLPAVTGAPLPPATSALAAQQIGQERFAAQPQVGPHQAVRAYSADGGHWSEGLNYQRLA